MQEPPAKKKKVDKEDEEGEGEEQEEEEEKDVSLYLGFVCVYKHILNKYAVNLLSTFKCYT